MSGLVVGIDLGASGSRLAAARPSGPVVLRIEGPPVVAGVTGADAAAVLDGLAARLRAARDEPVAALVVGSAGMSTLVPGPVALRDQVAALFGTGRCAVAADLLTAHVGALGRQAGAVLAAGTGAVALGTDLRDVWHRADGWGHLLGDLGSGAWIGMTALRLAAEHLDGRGGSADLARAAARRFGPLETWPSQLYPRPDRARVLAGIVPDVATLATEGSSDARRVLADAAGHLADTLAAALVPGLPEVVALTGGLLSMSDELLRDPLLTTVRARRPGVEVVAAQGTPLDGALALARLLADDEHALASVPPYLF